MSDPKSYVKFTPISGEEFQQRILPLADLLMSTPEYVGFLVVAPALLELVYRRTRRAVVTTPDGKRVWHDPIAENIETFSSVRENPEVLETAIKILDTRGEGLHQRWIRKQADMVAARQMMCQLAHSLVSDVKVGVMGLSAFSDKSDSLRREHNALLGAATSGVSIIAVGVAGMNIDHETFVIEPIENVSKATRMDLADIAQLVRYPHDIPTD